MMPPFGKSFLPSDYVLAASALWQWNAPETKSHVVFPVGPGLTVQGMAPARILCLPCHQFVLTFKTMDSSITPTKCKEGWSRRRKTRKPIKVGSGRGHGTYTCSYCQNTSFLLICFFYSDDNWSSSWKYARQTLAFYENDTLTTIWCSHSPLVYGNTRLVVVKCCNSRNMEPK
jgi:hypothetical protein